MNRETKEISVGAHKLLVKTYASGREANAIQQAYFKGAKVEMTGTSPKISEFNPGVQFDVERELITHMVVSLDGSETEIVERCLDLPAEEYNEIVATLDGIVSKKKSS